MKKYKNLLEIFLSKRKETDRGINFISGKGKEEFVSYQNVLLEAVKLADKLKSNKIKQGDKAVFQIYDDKQFIISYWACVLTNVTLVPLPLNQNQENNKKVFKVLEQFDNSFLLVDALRYQQLFSDEARLCEEKQYPVIRLDELLEEENGDIDFTPYEQEAKCVDGDATAIIQFSSGSTGVPKGVITTHKNIIADITGLATACEVVKDDVIVSWVPLAHNFGLIGSHLLGVIFNLNICFLKMDHFLYHPAIWFECCTKYDATITCSPNFGYKYFLNATKEQELHNVDLTKLRLIINSAEPASVEVCDSFKARLKPYGLRENVFQIVYGLSESTAASTATVPNKKIESVCIDATKLSVGKPIHCANDASESTFLLELMTAGKPLRGLKVRITDEQDTPLEEQSYGNIQLKGELVCVGYYHNKEANDKLFTKDGWLVTGDMGFQKDGNLYVCGRKKDIIFVNGKNYYSSDLENVLYQYDTKREYIVTSIQKSDDMQDEILVFVKDSGNFDQFLNLQEGIKKELLSQCGLSIKAVIPVDEIPKTVSGKKQRYKLVEAYRQGIFHEMLEKLYQLKQPDEKPEEKEHVWKMENREKVILDIQNSIRSVLGVTVEDRDANLTEYGMNSIKAAQFALYIKETYGKELEVFFLFDYPTINSLTDYLIGRENGIESNVVQNSLFSCDSHDIAVIGMECRLPDANSVEQYWKNLLDGCDAIKEIPEERTRLYQYFKKKGMKQYGGFLNEVDMFSSRMFGITPIEAEKLDPQQRMLLDVTYDAFQNAGMDISNTKGSNTGVFVGITNCDYRELLFEDIDEDQIDDLIMTGNMMNMTAGRMSYVFDWHGPAVSIDTACSSSMVAIHEAVNSLRTMQCDMAVSGGVNLIFSPKGYIGLMKMKALSLEGHCKTFDESADGYCRSEGCGVVLLKRYEDAVRDGDHILAVIKGSAMNHDGRSNGLTAPNGVTQTELIKKALADAEIGRQDVDYIEAHGTGTKIGDPQEVNALSKIFCGVNKKIYLGSVKSNIGHAESAAGIASFIKTVILVNKGVIPKKIYCNTLNSSLKWEELPFEVNTENIDLPNGQKLRTAAVSSFGFSGTNVHMIVQQVKNKKAEEKKKTHVFTVSAISKELLLMDLATYRNYIATTENTLENVCILSNQMRSGEKYRLGILADSKEDLVVKLERYIELKSDLPKPDYKENVAEVLDASEFLTTESGEERLVNLYNQGAKIKWEGLRDIHSCLIDMPTRAKKKKKFWYQ